MTDYDSPWKEALDLYFEPFMAFFFPDAHAEIDWGRGYELLDKELQQIAPEAELGRRAVDKLVKVWRHNGDERWVLIHIEVQVSEEGGFPKRMYVYNYRVFDKYNREVVSLAVLADENPSWRPSEFGYSLWGFSTNIRFPVVKLLDYAARWQELEVDPNPFAMIVLAHVKTLETRHDPNLRRAWKVRLVKGLIDRGLSAADVRGLFRFIDWVMELSTELDKSYWHEIHEYAEEKRMPYITTPERMGREEGVQQARLEDIELGLEARFGAKGLELLPKIRQIEDGETLKALLRSLWTGSSFEEFVARLEEARPTQGR
ncbi:MAG: hypothetical protein NUV77_25595 [Thermoguttaceae bacterium]|jgi:hypothetical protein|nr:hypothetical protein [Thermoguttaceae bacterium]